MPEALNVIIAVACAVFCVTMAIDISIEAYHRIHGTPTAHRVFENVKTAQETTIKSLQQTNRMLQAENRILKERVNNYQKLIEEADVEG